MLLPLCTTNFITHAEVWQLSGGKMLIMGVVDITLSNKMFQICKHEVILIKSFSNDIAV